MILIHTQAAQGDCLFHRIDALPADAKPAKAENGAFIVAHSETGHNHEVMERPGIQHFTAMDQFRSYLVIEGEPAPVEHRRSFHTHETLNLAPGIWEIRRQREYVPEGFRMVAD